VRPDPHGTRRIRGPRARERRQRFLRDARADRRFGPFNFLQTGATDSPEPASEPPCGGSARDVWFEWTCPSPDFVRVNDSSTLAIRVYAGSGCPTAGSLINCSNMQPFMGNAGAT